MNNLPLVVFFISAILFVVIALLTFSLQRQYWLSRILQMELSQKKLGQEQERLGSFFALWLRRIFERFLPQKNIANLRHKIMLCHDPAFTIEKYFLMTIMFSMIIFFVFPVILEWAIGIKLSGFNAFLISLVGVFLPEISLKDKINYTQKKAAQELPQYANTLRVCIEAGLDLQSAFYKLAEKFNGILGNETKRLVKELRLGKPLHDGLEDMTKRLEVPEFTTLCTLLIQSSSLGISVAAILKVQAYTAMQSYVQNVREYCARIPSKLMGPMLMNLINTFALALGPGFISFFESGW